MVMDLSEVAKLSALARINLTPQEQERLSRELGDILNYVSKVNELAQATPHDKSASAISSNLRDDAVVPDPNYQAALKSADRFKNNMIEVPPVFEK